MSTISDINENIINLLNNIEDEEILEEIKFEYEPFKKNMHLLLECDSIDSYLEKYEIMCKEANAVLLCFENDNAEELKAYINEQKTSIEELRLETVQASCDALEFIIFELEEDY